MGSWELTNYAISTLDKSKAPLIRQLFECFDSSFGYFEDSQQATPEKEMYMDFVAQTKKLPLTPDELFTLMKRVFGKTFLLYGEFTGS